MPDQPMGSLWDFSLAVYRSEAVQKACLALQDRHGLDVNILLFCCWLAAQKKLTDGAAMDAVLAETRDWHSTVVVPLRAIRRNMKGGIGKVPVKDNEVLRARIKTLELEAERLEQLQLETAITHLGIGASDSNGYAKTALANLRSYFSASQLRPGPENEGELELLVGESERLNPHTA